MITSVEQEKAQSKKRLGILAEPSLMLKVDEVAKELNFTTRTKALAFLTQFYEQSQHSSEGLPIATFEQIAEVEAPVVISGIPGSGKSWTLDAYLKECRKRGLPFLLFNSDSRDHDWISNRITFAEVVGLQWLKQPSQYVVSLDHNLGVRQIVMEQIAQSILMLEGDPRLESWTLAFEEGHDYYAGPNFSSMLRRMRKSTKKLIVVSTEAELFKMCRPFKPIPFKQLTS